MNSGNQTNDIDLDKVSFENLLEVAKHNFTAKKYNAAIEILHFALQRRDRRYESISEAAISYLWLARCYKEVKLIDDAILSFEQAIPRFSAKNLETVIDEYHELLSLSKRSEMVIYSDALNSCTGKNYPVAIEKLQYALNKFSGVKKATCYYSMASIFNKMDEKEQAIECCKNAAALLKKLKSAQAKKLLNEIDGKLKEIIAKNPCYYFNTKLHYKIWFSADPNVFLDIENQLRFVRAVNRNPGVTFTFIYSSRCLSAAAIKQLKAFCEKYNIIPLDFDTDLRNLLSHENDKTLYQLAELEINYGSRDYLVAASDITRQMIAVIEKCGIHGDFENEFDFSNCPELIECDTPFILNVDDGNINNDIFAVSVEKDNPSQLSAYAIEKLKCAQEKLISYYQQPDSILFGWHKNSGCSLANECPMSHSITAEYFKKNPDASIFTWKKIISEFDFAKMVELLNDDVYQTYIGELDTRLSLPLEDMRTRFAEAMIKQDPNIVLEFKAKNLADLAEQVCEIVQYRLLKAAVTLTSGAKTLNHLFDMPEHFSPESYDKFNNKLNNCSHMKHMGGMYIKPNEYAVPKHPLEVIGCYPDFDCSWTIQGAKRKNERIADLIFSATAIQRAWRSKMKNNDSFFKPFQSVNNNSEAGDLLNNDVTKLKQGRY